MPVSCPYVSPSRSDALPLLLTQYQNVEHARTLWQLAIAGDWNGKGPVDPPLRYGRQARTVPATALVGAESVGTHPRGRIGLGHDGGEGPCGSGTYALSAFNAGPGLAV
jgi:hypothetical protein